MISRHAFLRNLINVLKMGNTFDGITLTMAYENEIKPYPIEKPIIAFMPKKVTMGERLISIGEDGSETRTKSRIGESVFKATIFVPYETGASECYLLAEMLYSKLLFDSELNITQCQYHECNYVRECGALVMETDFTMRDTYNS